MSQRESHYVMTPKKFGLACPDNPNHSISWGFEDGYCSCDVCREEFRVDLSQYQNLSVKECKQLGISLDRRNLDDCNVYTPKDSKYKWGT